MPTFLCPPPQVQLTSSDTPCQVEKDKEEEGGEGAMIQAGVAASLATATAEKEDLFKLDEEQMRLA